MLKLMEIQPNEPNLPQKQISNQLGFSDSTIKGYRDDLRMNGPYKRGDYKRRFTKQKLSSSTKESSKSITNRKTKNIVFRKGDPSNIHISGK